MLATTGSSPGTVNVMSVLWPSAPRAVVTLGVAPLSPFSPLAPSLIAIFEQVRLRPQYKHRFHRYQDRK